MEKDHYYYETKIRSYESQIESVDYNYKKLNTTLEELENTLANNNQILNNLDDELISLGCTQTIYTKEDNLWKQESMQRNMNSIKEILLLDYKKEKEKLHDKIDRLNYQRRKEKWN